MSSYVVLTFAPDSHFYSSGFAVFQAILPDLTANKPLEIDFTGVTALPTSFLNGLFGEIISNFGVEKMKALVKPKGLTKAQSQMIKDYVNNKVSV